MIRALKRRQLIYEAVQEEIKAYIIDNLLKPGDLLPSEVELVQQLGVSRNSVREALKSLETLGVLEARPGIGIVIRAFSFDSLLENLAYGLMFDQKELIDIIEVRYQLEYGMAGQAVQAVTQDQLRLLRNILDRMYVAAENGNYSDEDDRAFHKALWENVNNIMLGKILDIFWMVHHQSRQRDSISAPPDPVRTYERHLAIVEALEKRDVEALRAAMTAHYESMRARLRQVSKLQEAS
ncbi:MAG: FadR family transcriptional regulator [Ardenticatenaceae bacterium]|nr:FadR family transcriptional regulator [Ardenticatenaceae bacterium]HBY99251.1 GntR family transcriptional regulator [Chloroflexota bacterium]